MGGSRSKKYEVTQAQWRVVASTFPKVNRDLNPDPSHFKGDNLPVEQVSWDDAVEFCLRLSQKTERKYRLPSEAEWEYACRAGTNTPFAFGETITIDLANYGGDQPGGDAPKRSDRGKSKELYRGKTTGVGELAKPNAFGLLDMHGNVWEWCLDVSHDNYKNAPADGSAWDKNGDPKYRIARGGSWLDQFYFCRSASRYQFPTSHSFKHIGFRVVMSVAQAQ